MRVIIQLLYGEKLKQMAKFSFILLMIGTEVQISSDILKETGTPGFELANFLDAHLSNPSSDS